MRVDPVSYALAQLETAQTGLRNAQVTGINLRLAGVSIFDTGWDNEYGTSSAGLRNWQTLLAPYRTMYGADMNSAYTRVGPNGGIASKPGHTSVNLWYLPTAFRHELGHNVGGSHCNTGGANDYRFGYNNGKSKTFLCGNTVPYYSNPAVTDSDGLPLGNARTADMARLWREQADRMMNYTAALSGERFFFATTNQWKSDTFEIRGTKSSKRAGIVATAQDIGPTHLTPLADGGYAMLNVTLTNSKHNKQYTVKFRAQRQIGNCPVGPMNSNVECPSGGPLKLILTYHPADNKSLPLGTYNGLLTLAASNEHDSANNVPIQTVISLARTAIAEAGWDFSVSSKPSSAAYPMNGSNSQGVASARWTIVDDPDHRFWLQEAQGTPWIRQFDGLNVRALVPSNTTGSVTYRLTVTDKYGLTSSTDINLTVK
ncbi:hypothetical protein C6Q35_27745 [Burkholderia multivorans]|nr:hypothetical protein C6Q35_27745 [Burkholderia multivorans]